MRWSRAAAAAIAFAAAVAGCLFPSLGDWTGAGDATADASADARSDGDASGIDAPASCDPSAPFTSVTALGGASLPNVDEFKAALTADELEIWLTTQKDGGTYSLESATRGSLAASFGSTAPDPNLNATGDNVDPTLSDDGLTVIFPRQPGQVGGYDLYRATRASRAVGFDPPSPMVNVQSTADEIAPFLAADGSLYFASRRTGNYDLFVAVPSGSGFATPTALAELNTTADELGVIVTRDGLWAYVESHRTDLSIGGGDIFRAHRSTTADPFGPLQAVAELETQFEERATWISTDNCRLYFESDRNTGGTGSDIFVASKSP